MIYVIGFVILFIFCIGLANGIENMRKNHPDYDGKDLFNDEKSDPK